MKKINEIISEFIEENLKNPQKIVFMGSMGQGSYSGATAYQGAFFLESELKVYTEKELPLPNTQGGFHELDGKHSYVEGEPKIITFDSLKSAFQWYLENYVELDYYQDEITEQYKITMIDDKLVLQNEDDNSDVVYETSPILLTDGIWVDLEYFSGVFTELNKKFELVTVLAPKKEVAQ